MKTRPRLGSIACWLLVGLTLGGCATSPSYFYTLTSTLPVPEKATPPSDQGPAIGIGPVRFPEFLDRPQVVTRATANQLLVDEFHRWGGSLEDDFLRVLGENLSQLLGTSRILVEPAEARFPLDFRVIADVLRFEGTPEGGALFKVRWGILDAHEEQTLLVRENTYRGRAANAQPAALIYRPEQDPDRLQPRPSRTAAHPPQTTRVGCAKPA